MALKSSGNKYDSVASGTTGQQVTPPAGDDGAIRYNTDEDCLEVYNRGKGEWECTGRGVVTGDTPPTTPGEGDLWFDIITGTLFIYLCDDTGSNCVWVDASPSCGGGSGGGSGDPDQDLYQGIKADNGGSVTASSTTDVLEIKGGTNIDTTVSQTGGVTTVTIDSSGGGAGGGGGGLIASGYCEVDKQNTPKNQRLSNCSITPRGGNTGFHEAYINYTGTESLTISNSWLQPNTWSNSITVPGMLVRSRRSPTQWEVTFYGDHGSGFQFQRCMWQIYKV